MTQSVILQNVAAGYGGNQILKDFNIEVRPGELLAVLGPSGCGKSTFLNLIAGFVKPTRGKIFVGERDVTDVSPQGRKLSMVFQSYALFPHMTVRENVAYGLQVRRIDRMEISRRVVEALASVGLDGFGDRFPRQLSGGQQQRVSLARAMVVRPEVLLLDEPLSNLDAKLRREMRIEVKEMQRRLRTTTILVTHDQDEALSMADRVAIMRDGGIEQLSAPLDVYRLPSSHFVAEFVGRTNSFQGRILGGEPPIFQVCNEFFFPVSVQDAGKTGERLAIVRPEAVRLYRPGTVGVMGQSGTVRYLGFVGSIWECRIMLDSGHDVMVSVRPDDWVPSEGDPVLLAWRPEDVVLLNGR